MSSTLFSEELFGESVLREAVTKVASADSILSWFECVAMSWVFIMRMVMGIIAGHASRQSKRVRARLVRLHEHDHHAVLARTHIRAYSN